MVNIFDVPVKETVNRSLQSKSIMIVGKSKTGKSTIAAQASRPVFLMTENGGEGLTGFTPIPIGNWSDFKSAVTQLCSPQGREHFDTVVIDTYTNLIMLLDKYVGQKMSTEKQSIDFGSDADYGKGAKRMRNELGVQLQKLANQGYLLLNIVHAEDKVDFETSKSYIGTSLSNSLYGVAEKFVDQIVYLRKDRDKKTGNMTHTIWFNPKGGFDGAGGRFTPEMDSVPCSFKNLEDALLGAIDKMGANGTKLVESSVPSVVIEQENFDFDALLNEFKTMTDQLMADNAENGAAIKATVEKVLGPGKKVSALSPNQAELLAEINSNLKNNFNI